ncbi:MAG: phosphoribosyl-AMP cyclohydrolase [Chloroflexi bacterium]|nr:phosphoribosyl-AMP cyclohydrolase [Chloroflexota bacterium]MCY3696009.1 phosphoribosyl-AMP cyclohydrolase [Chloroflexota bacterium]
MTTSSDSAKSQLPELKYDANGLIPAIVQDDETNDILMLGYMNARSLELTLEKRLVTFWSRSRQEYWTKGETSGNVLELVDIRKDCDVDALLVRAVPHGPTCHTGNRSCFYRDLHDI